MTVVAALILSRALLAIQYIMSMACLSFPQKEAEARRRYHCETSWTEDIIPIVLSCDSDRVHSTRYCLRRHTILKQWISHWNGRPVSWAPLHSILIH